MPATMPKPQQFHNAIDRRVLPWLSLHYPESYQHKGKVYAGRVFLGYRRAGSAGIYDLTRRNMDELAPFVEQMHISTKLDYYIMANSVRGVQRNTEGIFSLHNIVIDIDCHTDEAEPAEVAQAFLWLCSRDLWTAGEQPEPNSIVLTGRGLQMWWAIGSAPVWQEWIYSRVANWLADGLQEVLAENAQRLPGLAIDRTATGRAAGWYRLPLTYNTKAKRLGSLQIRRGERYTLQELADAIPSDYAPRKKSGYRQAPRPSYAPLRSGDREVLGDGCGAMARRVFQLVRLRALRDAAQGEEMRDRFCFAVYCSLLADNEEAEAWEKLLAFNAGFKQPLPSDKLAQMMSSATKKAYHLSNSWLIDSLEITEAEQEAIGLHGAGSVAFQNRTREEIRAAIKQDRNYKILALCAAGRSKSSIAKELNISRSTVYAVIAEQAEAEARQTPEPEGNAPMAAGAESTISPLGGLSKNGHINMFPISTASAGRASVPAGSGCGGGSSG